MVTRTVGTMAITLALAAGCSPAASVEAESSSGASLAKAATSADAATSAPGTPTDQDPPAADGGTSDDVSGEVVVSHPPVMPTVPTCATRASGFLSGRTIVAAGETRSYDLWVPPGADASAALPLVFVFHADDGVSLRGVLGLEQVTGKSAIIVYPRGKGGAWNLAQPSGNDDYAFVAALKAAIVRDECADASRTYAFGFSNGAVFANLYACFGPADTFRAIATHSGSIYAPEPLPEKYDANGALVCPSAPPAALVLHGQQDDAPYVSYNDGAYAAASWRSNDGCGAATASTLPASCQAYTCAKKTAAFCSIPGLGHAIWSQAATASWAFFSAS